MFLLVIMTKGSCQKNIARVRNCPDITILNSLFGLLSFFFLSFFAFLSFCRLSVHFLSFYHFVFLSYFHFVRAANNTVNVIKCNIQGRLGLQPGTWVRSTMCGICETSEVNVLLAKLVN